MLAQLNGWAEIEIHLNLVQHTTVELFIEFSLWFLWIPWPTFGFTKRTDGCIAVNLLMTWEAGLEMKQNKDSENQLMFTYTCADHTISNTTSACDTN